MGGLPLRSLLCRRRAAERLNHSESVVLDAKEAKLTGFYTAGERDTLVVLIHGWEGDAQSSYLVSAADALSRRGHGVMRLQLRDHGDSHACNREPFLGSEHAEVLSAIAGIQDRWPSSEMHVVGFSLGGNFAVRLAAFAPDWEVRLSSSLAICPPVRPLEAAQAISRSLLYNRYFAMRWKRSIRKKIDAFESWRVHRDLLQIDDILDMHEAFVPRFTQFRDATAYFESYALGADKIASVSCPTEMLLAADDPVCPIASLSGAARVPGLSTTIVPRGGHCAFLDSLRLTSWVDQYVCDWVGRWQ